MSSLRVGARTLLTCLAATKRSCTAESANSTLRRSFASASTVLRDTDAKSKPGGNALLDIERDSQTKELFAIPVHKPLIPGGIPQYLHIADASLIKHFKELEQLGGPVTVAAFTLLKPDAPGYSSSLKGTESSQTETPAQTLAGVTADDLHEVGTIAIFKKLSWGTQSGVEVAQIGLQGHRRIKRVGVLSTDPLKLQCMPMADEPYNKEDSNAKATHQGLVTTMKQIFEMQPLYLEQLRHVKAGDFADYARFADLVVSLVNYTVEDGVEFLAETNVPKRLMKALSILKKEVDLIQLQKDISKRVEDKFTKEQKKYFLMEQMKHIQRELGITKDERGELVTKFADRFAPRRKAAPLEVQTAVDEELAKLGVLDPASSEYNVTRNYLDWLTAMPYGVFSEERFDIDFARECLDAQHYGLVDVKTRILEFIAIGKLNDKVQGKIVCMVGPPGVGKTSIGKSIAKSLGRQFFRFSVGGLTDVAEIKGHRRTYVGAMPGKLIQCLKHVQSSNPMVLIDEIDKLGRGLQGDPASALLEVLDPEQNGAFRDHYLDVPLDLSKVLFVCTANVLDTIPRPLLDRMEIIEVSGYTTDEKRHIAREYLEKEVRATCAIPENSAELSDGALEQLIQNYCRESGVRSLKKQLEKIYRKVALKLATSGAVTWEEEEIPAEELEAAKAAEKQESEGKQEAAEKPDASSAEASTPESAGTEGTASAAAEEQVPEPPKTRKKAVYSGETMLINEDNLNDYVGKPVFNSDRFYGITPPGVVMGLAWTSMGGSTLYVESGKVCSTGAASMTLTGQLGDVMKESMTIAQTYSRALVRSINAQNEMLENGTVHVHVPQGGIPKDGPSAGCTVVSALLSLAFDTPVIPDVAMTGEISLSGHLLPIGGVKEKVLAAKRSGVKTVFMPTANRRDWEELSDELREGLEAHFPSHYMEMFPLLFPSLKDKYTAELEHLSSQAQLFGTMPAAGVQPAAVVHRSSL